MKSVFHLRTNYLIFNYECDRDRYYRNMTTYEQRQYKMCYTFNWIGGTKPSLKFVGG